MLGIVWKKVREAYDFHAKYNFGILGEDVIGLSSAQTGCIFVCVKLSGYLKMYAGLDAWKTLFAQLERGRRPSLTLISGDGGVRRIV